MCRVLNVSRSGYYQWGKRTPSRRKLFNNKLSLEINRIHVEVMQTYGSPRMHAELCGLGYVVGRGRVERLMSSNNIQAVQAKRDKRAYKLREAQQPEPHLLARNFVSIKPNEKWGSDITFIETAEGWLY